MSVPSALMKQPPIQSTAGAVPVRNEKGEISMEKVKVKRYVSGKRPDYAPMESSDEEDEEFQFIKKAKEQEAEPEEQEEDSSSDPRLRRLQNRISEDPTLARHRKIVEPEVVGESDSEVEGDAWRMEREDSSEEEEEEIDDEVESLNPALVCPRPHVVPVRKDRVTVQEREAEALKQKELEQEAKRMAEERRKYTLKIVEEETKKELEENKRSLAALDALNTDDENDEEEYEAWKVRELKRIKRDREDREALEKEKAEIERMRNLTEEERRAELRANGKVITNKADEDEEVYKRDFSAPTLEDHFNKTILPKVMQVKNFGRSGRTKYTHLVDQDTTSFDSAWGQESAQNTKFFKQKAAGVRDVFERPSAKKRKTT
ncbi:hypothetical protein A6R68_18845 [Neotoma lepida]|uniref:Micro-fibrillar-associated protein 1 C-terminal domain-containing protein n=1 Tax=Neotoma lepida TaxID=56216 RepID=A0A1A6HLC7_NEOLE|nr:hypothetical protein A6R68_18845 [Neotoma lepida]